MSATLSETAAKKTAPAEDSFISKFTVLRGALRELWVMFGTKVLTIVAYGLVNSTLILWLSKDMNFGDVSAGFVVTLWSTIMTLITVMIGSLVDTIGVKKSLIIGVLFCIVARGIMCFFNNPWLGISGLLPLAIGEAMMTPVIVAGIKKYATVAQRSIAFSLFYVMMNVGFAISGTIFDKVRTNLGEYGSYTLPGFDCTFSTYQTLIFLGFIITIPNLLLVWFGVREGISVNDKDEIVIEKRENKYSDLPTGKAIFRSCKDCGKEWLATFSSLWKQPTFYRFLAFLSIVVCVRLIFFHFHYTFPKYAIRELGEGAPMGRLFGVLNPVLIIFLGPIIGVLTQKYSAYKVVVIGSFIAACSVFFMAAPPVWYEGLAHGTLGNFICNTWLGQNVPLDQINPLFVSIFFAVIVLSVGEAFYSPRLYEYPAAIAPKGQEGSYMSLSLLPYFVAKFFVGALSGWLLIEFCPAEGVRNSEMMWFVIGLMAMLTPFGLLAFKKYIQVKESGRD